jgi:predicted phage terminase large subunit-like protein
MERNEAALKVLQREEARVDILEYIRYMRPAMLLDFNHRPAKHHRVFSKLQNEMAQALWEQSGEDDRTCVSVPPGAAKSFYWTIVWPTQLLARNPTWKILCVSAGETLAEGFAYRRRQIMLTKQWQELSGTRIAPDARGLGFQGTPEGGGIYAYGAGSTIQGIRADALIGDDLVTGHEQAGSLAQLDKLWNWYLSEARERLRKGGIEAFIATRWALLDPIGRAIRLTESGKENWNYLRIPMICDSDDDPLGRKLGERLWPEWYTTRKVKEAQRNPLIFATLHQQNPAVTEYSWVALDHIHIRKLDSFPEPMKYYIGVDIAHKLGQGDFTVFCVVGLDQAKNIYLVHVWRKQVDDDASAKIFLTLCQNYHVNYAFIDNDNASIVWGKLVQSEAWRQNTHSPLRLVEMKNRDKEVRAMALRTLFIQNRVRIAEAPWTQIVVREVAEFPDGRNDDIVDAFGVVAQELHKITGPKVQQGKPEELPIEGAFQVVDGQVMTRQPLKELTETLSVGRRRRI